MFQIFPYKRMMEMVSKHHTSLNINFNVKLENVFLVLIFVIKNSYFDITHEFTVFNIDGTQLNIGFKKILKNCHSVLLKSQNCKT